MKATHTPPTTADVDPTPADILRGAALYLARHGWTQGSYFADIPGTSDLPARTSCSEVTPPACALGAIAMAAHGQRSDDPDALYLRPESSHYNLAAHVLGDYLDVTNPDPYDENTYPDCTGIGDWNDEPGRTLAEVITALSDAADEWDHAHTLAGASA